MGIVSLRCCEYGDHQQTLTASVSDSVLMRAFYSTVSLTLHWSHLLCCRRASGTLTSWPGSGVIGGEDQETQSSMSIILSGYRWLLISHRVTLCEYWSRSWRQGGGGGGGGVVFNRFNTDGAMRVGHLYVLTVLLLHCFWAEGRINADIEIINA